MITRPMMTQLRARASMMMLLFFLLAPPLRVGAHGGEDHGHAGAAPSAVPAAQAGWLSTFGQTEQFELLVKYPPPKRGEPGLLRIYLADYPTNRPIVDAAFDLAFSPSGVKLASVPAMRSPGIYELTATFPTDTVYTLVATVTAGQRTDFVEIRNIYAGEAARRFLADHGGADVRIAVEEEGAPAWGFVAAGVALLAAIAIVAIVLRRRAASKPHEAGTSRGESHDAGKHIPDEKSTAGRQAGEDRR
jgi:hypothetical protein